MPPRLLAGRLGRRPQSRRTLRPRSAASARRPASGRVRRCGRGSPPGDPARSPRRRRGRPCLRPMAQVEKENWYLPRYVPPGEIARGLPCDSHCAIDSSTPGIGTFGAPPKRSWRALRTLRATRRVDWRRSVSANVCSAARLRWRSVRDSGSPLRCAQPAREHHVALDELALGRAVHVTGRGDRRGRRRVGGGSSRSLRDCCRGGRRYSARSAHGAQGSETHSVVMSFHGPEATRDVRAAQVAGRLPRGRRSKNAVSSPA